jgi:hypothetical protein
MPTKKTFTTDLLELSHEHQHLEPEHRPVSPRIEMPFPKLAHQLAHLLQPPPLATPSSIPSSKKRLLCLVLPDEAELEPEPVLGRTSHDGDGLSRVESTEETVEGVLEGIAAVGGGLLGGRGVDVRGGGLGGGGRVENSKVEFGEEAVSVGSGKSGRII